MSMKTKPACYLLKTNLFLFGLSLLLLNDFYLKYEYSNFLTGKLSDFVGLFIFPFFISIFIPKPKIIYILTAVSFTFWKLEYSQPLIDLLCRLTNLGFHRTVDPTDLFALCILPFSYFYYNQKLKRNKRNNFGTSFAVSIIAMFSFCATTLPRMTIKTKLKADKTFVIGIRKDELFKKLNNNNGYTDSILKNLTDTLFYLCIPIPEYNAEAIAVAKIKSFGKDSTIIKLDSITECDITGRLFIGVKQSNMDACNKLTIKDFESYFEKNFIDIIKTSKLEKTNLWFFNKE